MDDVDLQSRKIAALPIVDRYLMRLGVKEMLSGRMDGGGLVSHTDCMMILLKNIIMEREPLYGIAKWTKKFEPSLLGLSPEQLAHINDDRIGRTLDVLFDADRGSMLTEIARRTVRNFGIRMDEFHNDSTTITLSGDYEDADGTGKMRKETPKVTYGHNKDHRPDLKQLLWTMTVSADHSVPVHYMALDGNTADGDTHIDTWNFMRDLCGSPDFIYVADSKLCSRENMKYIDENHGRFITVLPATRSEVSWFKEYIQGHEIEWVDAFSRKGKKGEVEFSVFESPIPSSEGFRIIWVWSSQKEEKDSETRDRAIRGCIKELDELEASLKKRHMKKERIIRRAERAISNVPYLKYEIREEKEGYFRQSGRGRPSDRTEYRKIQKAIFHISWKLDRDAIERDSMTDGMFPLISNCTMSGEEILARYKYQPMLEKRFEQLKTVYGVMPVLFKSIERIEGFLFLYFIAMVAQSLIERDLRIAMKERKMKSIPLYSEGRECFSPTTDRVISEFRDVDVHRLISNGKITRTFYTELDDLQRLILSLLEIPEEDFRLH